jgi:hypothetical protein
MPDRVALHSAVLAYGVLAGIVLAVGVLAGCTGGGGHPSGSTPPVAASGSSARSVSSTPSTAGTGSSPEPSFAVAGPVVRAGGSYTLDLPDAVQHRLRLVTVPAGDAHLARVSSTGGAARLAVHGKVATLRLPPQAGDVTVALDARQSWRLQLGGGAPEVDVDARAYRLRDLAVAGTVRRLQVAGGVPSGAVTISASGSVAAVIVHLPEGTTVQAQLSGGAGSASLYGAARTSVRAGTVLATPSAAADYYRIDVARPLTSLVVDSA